MVNFRIDDVDAFTHATDLLARLENKPLTQNFAVAMAVLMHRRVSGNSGAHRILYPPDDPLLLVSTNDLQHRVCDSTWEKAPEFLREGAEKTIFKPFTQRFYPPSNNNWRNSFDLQAGLACDAPSDSEFLLSDQYVSQPRFDCVFRDPDTASCSSPAGLNSSSRTCFNPSKRNEGLVPGPETGARHRPKLLTRGYSSSGDSGYWYVEPTLEVLVDLLSDPESRIPLLPFIASLYLGSPYWIEKGTEVSAERLKDDLSLDSERFLALFDTSNESPQNGEMLQYSLHTVSPPIQMGANTVRSSASPELSAPLPYMPRDDVELTSRAGAERDPDRRVRLLERAISGHRRTLNQLATLLINAGYVVDEQLDGYDLHATREDGEFLFEVKTWTDVNLLKQIRSGWAQLYEYRYRNGFGPAVVLCLVFDRPPPSEVWVWPWLVSEIEVLPCWIDGGMLDSFADFRASLPGIMALSASTSGPL